MTRPLSVSLLASICLAGGCAGHERVAAKCEWLQQEPASSLDLRNPSQQRHLSDDALVAEDLAIRYADFSKGLYSRDFKGSGEYSRARDQCMAALFAVIGSTHRVTSAQVREALGRRRTSLDLAVILSFGGFYALAASSVAWWIFRRTSHGMIAEWEAEMRAEMESW